jgi:hypothetical protein
VKGQSLRVASSSPLSRFSVAFQSALKRQYPKNTPPTFLIFIRICTIVVCSGLTLPASLFARFSTAADNVLNEMLYPEKGNGNFQV